jgi:sugar phosphate isomerase/epimerase
VPTRRSFIKKCGLLGTAVLLAPSFISEEKYKLGLQLYTIREVLEKDLKGTLEKVASFGYQSVEIYGFLNSKYYGVTPKQFKQLLDDTHLTTPSGHYDLNKLMLPGSTPDDLKRYVDECIEGAHILKQEYIVWPGLILSRAPLKSLKSLPKN